MPKEATGVVSPTTGRVQVKDTGTGQVSFVEKGSAAESKAVGRASEGTQAAIESKAASPGAARRIAEPIDKLVPKTKMFKPPSQLPRLLPPEKLAGPAPPKVPPESRIIEGPRGGIERPRGGDVFDEIVTATVQQEAAKPQKKPKPEITLEQFSNQYLTSHGVVPIHRGTIVQSDVPRLKREDKLRNDAARIYTQLYGSGEVAKQGGLKLADILVPGVWLRHAKDMDAPQLVLNTALDLLILAPVVGLAAPGIKPIAKSMFKTIFKPKTKPATKKELTKAFADVLEKFELGAQRSDAGFIREGGQDLKALVRRLEAEGVQKGNTRPLKDTGAYYDLKADDVADALRAGGDRQLSPAERKILKGNIKQEIEVLDDIKNTFNKLVTRKELKKGLVIIAQEPPRARGGVARYSREAHDS